MTAGWIDWSHISPEIMTTLRYWYGEDKAGKVKYVEAYGLAEFGRQPNREELITLTPMINSPANSNAQ